jgi:hypothetical protein
MAAANGKRTPIASGKEFPGYLTAGIRSEPAERIHYEKKIIYFR